jgi:hypothetical protein
MPVEPETEVSAGSFEHTNTFWHNLTANAITCDYGDSEGFQIDSTP